MKKWLKRIALTLVLAPVVLLVIGVIAHSIYGLLALGGESQEHQTYLQAHKEELTANSQFELFDSSFYSKQIFLLGEVHGFAQPQELDYNLLKHLHAKINLRYYLAEVDGSQAHFLNEYLTTGDESLLEYVFQTWVTQNAQWGNQEFFDKIKKIRTLNETLPEAKKIKIVGVDRIQDLAVTNRFLKEIVARRFNSTSPEGQPDAKAKPYLDTLQRLIAIDTVSTAEFGAFAKGFLKTITQDSTYHRRLATDYAAFTHTLQNLAYLAPRVRRDSVMFLNLKNLTQQNGWQNEKFYGMWGLFHALQVPVNENSWPLAAYLQHVESPFKGKVVSVVTLAIDSENMVPTAGLPSFLAPKNQKYVATSTINSDGPLGFVYGIKDLKAVTTASSVTLFKIDGPNSPYSRSNRLAATKTFIPGQSLKAVGTPVTTEVFQYVVLLRNAKALTPLQLK